MTAFINKLKDKTGNQQLPVTHERAVRDDNGTTLESKMQNLEGAMDKAYVASSDNGMGRITLKKNMVSGVNTLTQAMMQATNTIYVIQYDFTLGEDITIPANCVLKFDGGSVSNGSIVASGNLDIVGKGKISSNTLPIITSVVKNAECNINGIELEYTGASSDDYIINLHREGAANTDVSGYIKDTTIQCNGNCNAIDITYSHTVNINGCIFLETKDYAIKMENGWDNYVNDCRFYNDVHGSTAIYLNVCSGTRVAGNRFDTKGIGLNIVDGVSGILISDNIFETLTHGIILLNGASAVSGIGIIGNYFENCTIDSLQIGENSWDNIPSCISIIANKIAYGTGSYSNVIINSGLNISVIGNSISCNLTINDKCNKVILSSNLVGGTKTINTSNIIDLDENKVNFYGGTLMLNCTAPVDGSTSDGTINIVAGTENQIKLRHSVLESGKYLCIGQNGAGNLKIHNQDGKGIVIDMDNGTITPIS